MDLPPGEPECGPWRDTSPADLLDAFLGTPAPPAGPRIIGIDGRGGSGKTTLALAVAAAAARRGIGVDVVHTDDVAWHQSFFGWDGHLGEHVLRPVRAGSGADHRPPAWQERERHGAIIVSSRSSLVLVEGSGAARRSLAPLLDGTVWVQVDAGVAAARLRERDGDTAQIRRFIADWTREEEPFMSDERPWTRCTWVVHATPDGRLRSGRPASPD